MHDIAQVRWAFDVTPFHSSPLYAALRHVVARDDALLRLAAHARAEAQPPLAFFGAVHYLLLRDPSDPLADYYASVCGAAARAPDADVEGLFTAFCHRNADAIVGTLRARLVQTNNVQRSTVVLLGLALLRERYGEPVVVVDVGCSAGLNLAFHRYGYRIGTTTLGDASSPVQVEVDCPDVTQLPDLAGLPAVDTVVGVDLNPLNVSDPDDRLWLRALVWPENTGQADQLAAALHLAADVRPRVRAGDAVDVLPKLAGELPQLPRLVVQIATRMHVPEGRRAAFDAAVASLGDSAPQLLIALEDEQRAAPSGRSGFVITARDRQGSRDIAIADPHLSWLEGLPPYDGS